MALASMWTGFCRNGRGALLLFAGALLLSACQTPAPPGPQVQTSPRQPPAASPVPAVPEPQTPVPTALGAGGLILPHMEGRELLRIGLLLPFSARSAGLRAQARSMLNAAQMALFEARDPQLVLMPRDTGGTIEGAQGTAAAAISDGAAIIIGPVLGPAVNAAAEKARAAGIPVIAFSTDRSVSGNGVYLLSFTPEADMARMVDFIGQQNQKLYEAQPALRPDGQSQNAAALVSAVALLRPEGPYGDRIEAALFAQTPRAGLSVTDIARYGADVQSMGAPARQIAHVSERQRAIRAWRIAGGIGDPGLDPAFAFSLPYQAIFLPESGVRLRSLAPLLPFYDVDPKITRFIGVHLWNDEELLHEPALFGGWFPGPPAAAHEAFTIAYLAAFGEPPERLASLAHDAVLMVPQIAPAVDENHSRASALIDRAALERPEGFSGADGVFRFTPDGLVQRLLSVFEIHSGSFREIDPAAATFADSEKATASDDAASY